MNWTNLMVEGAEEHGKVWDVFIAHASKDKESFVRPLAVALRQMGAKVWFDEFSLRVGQSLSECIDRGLAESRYGAVIITGQ